MATSHYNNRQVVFFMKAVILSLTSKIDASLDREVEVVKRVEYVRKICQLWLHTPGGKNTLPQKSHSTSE